MFNHFDNQQYYRNKLNSDSSSIFQYVVKNMIAIPISEYRSILFSINTILFGAHSFPRYRSAASLCFSSGRPAVRPPTSHVSALWLE